MGYRTPAWAALAPPIPKRRIAKGRVAERLLLQLGGGQLESVLTAAHENEHFLHRRSGQPARFIKLVERARAPALRAAEAIVNDAVAVGAPAVRLISESNLDVDDWQAFVYEFVDGRRVAPLAAEIRALGVALGRLHEALRASPHLEQIVTATGTRMARLLDARKALQDGREAGPHPSRLTRLARDRALEFFDDQERVNVLHGDANPGNVVLDHSGDVHFLDFEDVIHSALPRRFELAYVAERFVYVQEDDKANAEALVAELLDAYASVIEDYVPFDMQLTLRSLALRSLCVLADAEFNGASVPPSEWEKFFELETQARDRLPGGSVTG